MTQITSSRKSSFYVLAAVYFTAIGVGFLVYRYMNAFQCSDLLSLFVADVVATIVIWTYGLFYKNVSVYDPYWSVVPPVMLTAFAMSCGHWGLPAVLLIVAIWYWGIRLTGHWAYTFQNLDTEDWRYTKYRAEKEPFVFHIINFFGLNMIPTIVVFMAMLPAIYLLKGRYVMTDSLLINVPFESNGFTWLGFVICMVSVTVPLISDIQRYRFAKEHREEACKVGLWKHGRHPNCFGEISMWWGVWIMCASVADLSHALTFLVGPVVMTFYQYSGDGITTAAE